MKKRSGLSWIELIIGILLVLLGVLTFCRPEGMLTGIVVIYGIIAVIVGIEDIAAFVRLERFTGFGPAVSLISGILSVMCGIMLLAYPDAGTWILSLLFPVWFIAHCISRIAHAGVLRLTCGRFYYYFTLIVNTVGILLGFLMVFSPSFTFMTMRTIGYVAAFYLVLLGIESIVSSFDRSRP